MNVGFISLGCSKNLIDTEAAIGHFKKHNFKIVNDPAEAEIIVVNTCGFIESAKEEAINTILEMAEFKKGRCKYLIAMGCLVQRYYDELIKEIPEVNLFLKLDDYSELWEKIALLIEKDIVEETKVHNTANEIKLKQLPMFNKQEYLDRELTTGNNFAYLKIGEGCSNNCTYCAIPYIRGKFVSRPMEDILEEANLLAQKGIKELIVIAQDTTRYGEDIYGEKKLTELLTELIKIEDIKWIRFLYAYPEGITDELIELVKSNEKICKYFDIPIQHISNQILKKMNRKTTKQKITQLLEKIGREVPDAVLRTSLIVGFPGETEDDFEELYRFIQEIQFDKLGVFMYSKEEGTPAAIMENQISTNTKKSRYNKIMKKQMEISKEEQLEKIGEVIEVLIESSSFDKSHLIGRTKQDAPDIDGLVYIKNPSKDLSLVNSIVKCKVKLVKEYDLIAELI
ncbi:Ribosomal protein S12 methylthiotransferase RimO [compost metagenome]